jgi:cycloeucalenol cycloisomerase
MSTWLSPNADKAWAERLLLLYTPVWMAAVGLVMLTGWIHRLNDLGFMLFSVAVSAPTVVLPALVHRKRSPTRPWWRSYWFKLNAWVAVLVFGGTYFGTAYFFDLMGMRYAFDVQWMFESPVVGRAGGRVPLFMYPLTQAYFVSYFVLLTVAYRRASARQPPWGRAVVVLVLAYAMAFAETLAMANPLIEGAFSYADRTRMLLLGSWGYAVYFVIGLPMCAAIDEPAGGEDNWTLRRVLVNALATYMLILCGLEVWAQLIGPL